MNRIEGVVRARQPKRLPVVMTREEVAAIWVGVFNRQSSMTQSSIAEAAKAGITMLPDALLQPLQDHLRVIRKQHEADLKVGLGRAPLPGALPQKYPNADREWGWQWVFPASSHYLD